ncbi:MAG: hypothetical protein CME62_17105 [Halobacteriovoraceae bacterium]|nr:hypothetical protein [Halobacteriovoraceae bacterium]|tara:strand:+ start:2304 stop:3068 length:765 start_codon:yes stop_codon:yes gene_type:complete
MKTSSNQIILLILLTVVCVSCSTSPKGEYPSAKIDRPYNLPVDVAKVTVGYGHTKVSTEDESDNLGSSEDYSKNSLQAGFEDGVWKNVSWLYPIGIRWTAFQNDSHTFGVSGVTLLLASSISLDYWYRMSESFSLRPFYKNQRMDTFIIDSSRDTMGLELIYQVNEKFSVSPIYEVGRYSSDSELFETLFEDIDESDIDADFYSDGVVRSVTLELLYNINERWDIFLLGTQDKVIYEDYTLVTSNTSLNFNYFY